ncbi:MAG TPA: hypothetical protein VMS17_01900 [Gemmataceae bacterium]|nr:hypothetical protein [Gemmataceae bacterium]
MIDRILSSLAALCLALLVWLYARSRDQEILDNITLPVQISLSQADAEHYSLEVDGPAQAVVSFSGPAERIRELRGEVQRNELHIAVTVAIPEDRRNDARYSDTVHIEAPQVPAPPGVTPIVFSGRNRIPITIRHLVTQELRVTFDPLQEAPTGQLILEPEVVRVTAPQEVFDNHRTTIPTVPSALPVRPADAPPDAVAVGRFALVQELDGFPIRVDPPKVIVKAPAVGHETRTLRNVPIHFLCPPDFGLRPEFFSDRDSRVTLTVTGPKQADDPKVFAFIDLTHGHYESGSNHEPLQVQFQQREFELVDPQPRIVTFHLTPADGIPDFKGFGSSPP